MAAPFVAPAKPAPLDPHPASPLDGAACRRPPAPSPLRRPLDPEHAARVVVASADLAARTARSHALASAGLGVTSVGSLADAGRAVAAGAACLVSDRVVSGGDVLALVHRLDDGGRPPRMVVVAAGGSHEERLACLLAGADDVVEPGVSAGELVARVRRLLVPAGAPAPTSGAVRPIASGRVVIDQDRRAVRVDGTVVGLSPTQYEILVSLATAERPAVGVRELVERCWDTHQERSSCAVRTQVARLRRALGGAVEIRCVRGEGYQLAEAEG